VLIFCYWQVFYKIKIKKISCNRKVNIGLKRKLRNNNFGLLLILAIIIFFAGCSTQKNRFINRAYHIINAKYNGYFNARESYREGLKYLEEAHQDNYEQILDIFKYGSEQDVSDITSYMDVAYKKSSIVIQRHSMNIRGVEYNSMIDDAYFLIARSHFFKHDYHLAILTFEYIIRQYDTPLKYESKIWIVKCNNEMGRFNNSRQVLDILQSNYENGVLPDNLYRLFFLAYADYYYKQGRYEEAIPYMKKAIENTRRRRDRTRLVFILGQTYQEIGNYANAQNTYARVLRLNPDFDMEFRARINMAMSYDPEIGGGVEIREKLERMLRQDRNRDYRDQIYYALAKLSENQGLMDEAIGYYIKSTQESERNDLQKGLSFLRLGQIFYDKEKYYESFTYYDSTTTFLPGDFEDFDKIEKKRVILNELSLNIKLINNEDSLQHIASLPLEERNRIIDKIISEEREREREQREREREMMRTGQMTGRGQESNMMGGGQGGWYFYNPTAINFGQTEFVQRWGERKLEDLWRISNKQISIADGMMMDEFDMIEEMADEETGRFSRETYVSNLPLTPEKLDESNNRLIQAYYNKGLIYKDRIKNESKAIEAFETLIERFPDNDHKLYTYYFLYDIFSKNLNYAKANTYKNRIIDEFPDTDFAKVLSDPDYAENLRERQNRGNQLYKHAYYAYNNKEFDSVINYCNQADTMELNRELTGRFTYLKALTYGAMGYERYFMENLIKVVNDYEGTRVYEPAQAILAYLSDSDDHKTGADDKIAKKEEEEKPHQEDTEKTSEDHYSIYEYKPDAIHFFIFVVNTDKIDVRQLRNSVNAFNREAYRESNLTLSNIYLEDKKQILTVTNFENSKKASEYVDEIMKSDELAGYDKKHFESFTISVENYPLFYQDKNVDNYLSFYNKYYEK